MKSLLNNKITNTTGFILFCFITLISCDFEPLDFLDKPPGVDVTEDTIFSSQANAETFLAHIYQYGMHSDYAYWVSSLDGRRSDMMSAYCDEGKTYASWYSSNRYWNVAAVTPSNLDKIDGRWNPRWKALRSMNIMLERIDEVPETESGYANLIKGQVRFIRALNYFEMLKRYGGVPIITRRFQPSDELADLYVERNTFKEVVDFIIEEAEYAASVLPDSWVSEYRGKITKGAALMLKARTLLYAASPLFNTGTPYLNFGGNNDLICYGNYDESRWQLAADAAKAVIDWAPTGGISLVTDQGPDKNYKYVWEIPSNSEAILEVRLSSALSYTQTVWKAIPPTNTFKAQGKMNVNFNLIRKYENIDGTPMNWNLSGGDNLNEMFSQMDPRFKQTIAHNRYYWNQDYPDIQTFQGGANAKDCLTGFWLKKGYPDDMRKNGSLIPNWILYRLGEAYLNYAEALNEVNGPVAEAYEAINIIRNRSGMPDLPTGLSKDEFRERVRNERAVELAFEEHRIWDVKRWMIAEEDGVLKGDMWGFKIYEQDAPSTEYTYVPYVFEVRNFLTRMYLNPFPQSEVNKGYLIQNPGY